MRLYAPPVAEMNPVLSPCGFAVAVDEDGRALGVVSSEEVTAVVRREHRERTDSPARKQL